MSSPTIDEYQTVDTDIEAQASDESAAAGLATRLSIFDGNLHDRDVMAHWSQKIKRQDPNLAELVTDLEAATVALGNFLNETVLPILPAPVATTLAEDYKNLDGSVIVFLSALF